MVKHPFLNSYLTTEIDTSGAACKLEVASSAGADKDLPAVNDKATFWPEGWRGRLCRCSKCLVRHERHRLLSILNLNLTYS